MEQEVDALWNSFCTLIPSSMRHKVKIFASEIASLTDARYFSAIGAEWLGHFPEKTGLSDTDFASIKTWVTGPEWVLEQMEEEGAEEKMNALELSLYKLSTPKLSTKAHFVEYTLEQWLKMNLDIELHPRYWVVSIDEMPTEYELIRLKRTAGLHAILLKMPRLTQDQIIHIIQKSQPYGVVLCGSKEDKTGYKSFDRINDIIDKMQDLQWV